jgi:hypothetical protein
MISKLERKEAIRKFKEEKPAAGIFAIRCAATARVWVGASRNLDATRNGSWFMLRQGGHFDRGLQREWDAQGEASFGYEVLERLADDLLPMAVADLLKQKRAHWVEQLGAKRLDG